MFYFESADESQKIHCKICGAENEVSETDVFLEVP
jgi:hypothetical protein